MWGEAGDEVFVRYLLGELAALERDQFEDRYFADDAVHERLLAIECELIDAYVRRELSATESQDFERQYFTTPKGRERVARSRLLGASFARVLRPDVPSFASLSGDHTRHELPIAAVVPASTLERPGQIQPASDAHETTNPDSWWGNLGGFFAHRRAAWALTLIPAAALVAALYLIIVVQPWHQTPGGTAISAGGKKTVLPAPQSPRSASSDGKSSPLIPPSQTKRREPPMLLATLTPTLRGDATVRGDGGNNTLRLPATPGPAILRVVVPEDMFSSYRATVQTAEGKHVLARDHLHVVAGPDGSKFLELTFPSSLLDPGDYTVRISGIDESGQTENAGGYSFRSILDRESPRPPQFTESERGEERRTPKKELPRPRKLLTQEYFQVPADWRQDGIWWTHKGADVSWLVANQGVFLVEFRRETSKIGYFEKTRQVDWVIDQRGSTNRIEYSLDFTDLHRMVTVNGKAESKKVKLPLGAGSGEKYAIQMYIGPDRIIIADAQGKELDRYERPNPTEPLGRFGFKGDVALVVQDYYLDFTRQSLQDPTNWTQDGSWWVHRGADMGWLFPRPGAYMVKFRRQTARPVDWVIDQRGSANRIEYSLDLTDLHRQVTVNGKTESKRVKLPLAAGLGESYAIQIAFDSDRIIISDAEGAELDRYERPNRAEPLGRFGVKGQVPLVVVGFRPSSLGPPR